MTVKDTINACAHEIKERADPKTTGKFWRKIRNVAASIASGGVIVMGVLPDGKAKLITGVVTGIATALSLGAHADKSNKPIINNNNKKNGTEKKYLEKISRMDWTK